MDEKKVLITEIGPRDGFQSIKEYIPAQTKKDIIDATVAAGVSAIQCTSFVNPKAIPQMIDAAEIAEYVLEKYPQLKVSALVPNLRGAESAVKAGLKHISPVISLSVSHNQANVRRSHEQSLDEFRQMRDSFPGVDMDIDVATAFGCPFEGRKSAPELVDFIGRLWELGFRSYNICDTIGVAYPRQVEETFAALFAAFPEARLSAHIHDTRNMGIINTYTAIKCGVKNVQTTLGGLGGCPFAPGATGNTATEDLNYMLLMEGYTTGIDQARLMDAARLLHEKVQGNYSGHQLLVTQEHCSFMA